MATGGSDGRGRASRQAAPRGTRRPGTQDTVETLAPNRTESPSSTEDEPEEGSSQELRELFVEIGKAIKKDEKRGQKILQSYKMSLNLNNRKNAALKAKDEEIEELKKKLKAKEESEKKARDGERLYKQRYGQAAKVANFYTNKMTEITKEAPKMPLDAED